MTNQEAIKILHNLKPGDYSNPYEKGKAILMAIEALQTQPKPLVKDTISRQAAIDAMGKLYDADLEAYSCEIPEMFHSDRAIEALNALPPAQPNGWLEQNKDKILQAGMEGREIDFRIGGRLFAIREKAQ